MRSGSQRPARCFEVSSSQMSSRGFRNRRTAESTNGGTAETRNEEWRNCRNEETRCRRNEDSGASECFGSLSDSSWLEVRTGVFSICRFPTQTTHIPPDSHTDHSATTPDRANPRFLVSQKTPTPPDSHTNHSGTTPERANPRLVDSSSPRFRTLPRLKHTRSLSRPPKRQLLRRT